VEKVEEVEEVSLRYNQLLRASRRDSLHPADSLRNIQPQPAVGVRNRFSRQSIAEFGCACEAVAAIGCARQHVAVIGCARQPVVLETYFSTFPLLPLFHFRAPR
jgi:hypothetical protein